MYQGVIMRRLGYITGIGILFFVSLFVSCATEQEISFDRETLLVGMWDDTSDANLDFSLFPDGTARSESMSTLLYKRWELQDNNLIITTESIGNGISFLYDGVYSIETLNETSLVIRDGDIRYSYIRK